MIAITHFFKLILKHVKFIKIKDFNINQLIVI